ncbi:precorrin-2 C(20)-methyltransferase [Candidatus Poribacteria bacterium]|nr:precorrin-2 C(20)-methyltransferase [Candidatus Poribacteria bacterium]
MRNDNIKKIMRNEEKKMRNAECRMRNNKKNDFKFRNPQSAIRNRNGKLYGIGIGPGDPELLTLKAKKILEHSDIIFVPKAQDEGSSCARTIIEALDLQVKKIKELTFPMTGNKNVLKTYWLKAAEVIAKEVRKGKQVSFITIGDPLIYSTYIYLLRTLNENFSEIIVETIPGISAFNAAASRLQIPLVEGKERLTIIPVPKDVKKVKNSFENFDTIVLMKVGSKLDKVIKLLKEVNLLKNSVLISHVGHPNEKIIYDLSEIKDKKAGYLSIMIVKK